MAIHVPVMPGQVVQLLDAQNGGLFVDATTGLGGHSEAILEASDAVRVVGLDRDREALDAAQARLARFGTRFQAIHTDFRRIAEVLSDVGVAHVDGVLADLGVSSLQFDTPERGFSFRFPDEPLDMRMDRSDRLTAADLIATLSEKKLADLIFEFGEERAARRIARLIISERTRNPIRTVGQLAELVIRAIHQRGHWRVHPATKTFQALRIAVNRELDDLDGREGFVARSIDLLSAGGRLVVITFHSLEDRIIKHAFQFLSGKCMCPPQQPACSCGAQKKVELLTRKAIEPDSEEIEANPRARSAKLRACRKLPGV
jgi:16S rRNA (cytosine1402-N4)-methyltransferase